MSTTAKVALAVAAVAVVVVVLRARANAAAQTNYYTASGETPPAAAPAGYGGTYTPTTGTQRGRGAF